MRKPNKLQRKQKKQRKQRRIYNETWEYELFNNEI